MSRIPELVQLILDNIQADLADLRERLEAFERHVDTRFDAFEQRTEALQVELREFRDEQRVVRERLHREQMLRERNARRTIALMDALIDRVRGIDSRVTALEDS